MQPTWRDFINEEMFPTLVDNEAQDQLRRNLHRKTPHLPHSARLVCVSQDPFPILETIDRTTWLVEHHLATLIGIQPGLVILQPIEIDTVFAGVLEWQRDRIVVRSFISRPIGHSCFMMEANVAYSQDVITIKQGGAAYLEWRIGGGHGEQYGREHFSEERWQLMQRWFAIWLPKP